MRWGLSHSFKEGYTAKQIEEIIRSAYFKKVDSGVYEIDLI